MTDQIYIDNENIIINISNDINTILIEEVDPVVIETTCERGPTGPQGPPGDSPDIIAGEAISGHRVIAVNSDGLGVYADHNNISAKKIYGFSTGAAILGDVISIATDGVLSWPAGGLTPDSLLFLGSSGMITATPPTTGWLVQVAIALDTDLIKIQINHAYYLG